MFSNYIASLRIFSMVCLDIILISIYRHAWSSIWSDSEGVSSLKITKSNLPYSVVSLEP